MTRVLPEPAPATTSTGPSIVVTASLCARFSWASKSSISGCDMAKVYAYASHFAKLWESAVFCDFIFSTGMHVFTKMRLTVAVLFLILSLPHFLGAEDRGLWSNLGIIDIHAHIGSFRGYNIGLQPLLSNLSLYG